MQKYNIRANLVCTTVQLCEKATNEIQMNGSMGEWFRTTVLVRHGSLLSTTLINIFFKRIMSDALEEHDIRVSIGCRNITNLELADDIDALAEEEQELEALVESLDKTCTRYKIEISAEKTRLMTNSANGILREIKVKWQNMGTIQASSTSARLFQMMASNQRFSQGLHKPLQLLQSLSQSGAIKTYLLDKVKLMRSLVISIFLYACESWTLTAEVEKRNWLLR